jgi:Rrf2 family protein
MLRLSKKIEYGLLAVSHIAMHKDGDISTAKEISAKYEIPLELLSKILQKLAKEKIITSFQGMRGGYRLVGNPSDLKIMQIIQAIEGQRGLTECTKEESIKCLQYNTCTIRNPLKKLQFNIDEMFNNMTLSEII